MMAVDWAMHVWVAHQFPFTRPQLKTPPFNQLKTLEILWPPGFFLASLGLMEGHSEILDEP